MLKLVLRRAAMSAPVLLLVSALVFVLEAMTPGDVARTIIGSGGTEQQYQALRVKLGLNEPLYQQYWHYLDHLLHGSLGTSILTGEPVANLLDARLPASLSLILLSTALACAVGIPLGIVSAVRGGSLGSMVDALAVTGVAIPSFLVGLLFVDVFAVNLGLLPAVGYTPLVASPTGWMKSLILPVVALSLAGGGAIAKTTRESMLDVLDRPFIRSLRANGVSVRSIVWKHALRNAALPILSVINLTFIAVLGGTVFIESVFVIPGLGSFLVTAVLNHDIPEVEGAAIYFTVFVVVVNLLVDIAYGWANPKARLA